MRRGLHPETPYHLESRVYRFRVWGVGAQIIGGGILCTIVQLFGAIVDDYKKRLLMMSTSVPNPVESMREPFLLIRQGAQSKRTPKRLVLCRFL